jgi:hypothetical protein
MTVSNRRRQASADYHREADEFRFVLEKFDWKTGHEIPSENLNICVTPQIKQGACYTETQEMQIKQDIERDSESKELNENKEIQRKTRVQSGRAGDPKDHHMSGGP